ncbi:hypothetical protein [Umezawaea sp. Da 62-37]|uniref:hypothetical protein n=1 Tax=Umezawaea sp. Da 62-37 TaxID=3075927 RepID=UPI0028F6E69C|nr:hypothetical protein [Umezawaea sp. Da 62-37]WNV83062.1 hypothetical protein RM788_33390 [Umezawaea sp. Da 62-37]
MAPAPGSASTVSTASGHHRLSGDLGIASVQSHRRRLRSGLENLLALDALHQPHQALTGMVELWSVSGQLLRTPMHGTEEDDAFLGHVALIHERVDAHLRPWARVVELPTDQDTRVELAVTVLRLCLDLQSLSDRVHPDLRIRQTSTGWFTAWAARIVTLQADYRHEDTLPKVYTQGRDLN